MQEKKKTKRERERERRHKRGPTQAARKNAQSSAGQSWIQWQPHGNREKTGRSHPAQAGPHRKKRGGQATTKLQTQRRQKSTRKISHKKLRNGQGRQKKKRAFRKQTRSQSKTIAKHRGDKQENTNFPGNSSFSSRPCLRRLKVGGVLKKRFQRTDSFSPLNMSKTRVRTGGTLPDLRVSSLCRGHANFLCIVPSLSSWRGVHANPFCIVPICSDDPRRGSNSSCAAMRERETEGKRERERESKSNNPTNNQPTNNPPPPPKEKHSRDYALVRSPCGSAKQQTVNNASNLDVSKRARRRPPRTHSSRGGCDDPRVCSL